MSKFVDYLILTFIFIVLLVQIEQTLQINDLEQKLTTISIMVTPADAEWNPSTDDVCGYYNRATDVYMYSGAAHCLDTELHEQCHAVVQKDYDHYCLEGVSHD